MQNLFMFLAGIGMFLYAMHLLEDALKNLAGRTFKLFLRKHTTNTLEAIGSGALVTTILQSSSVVILIILAFLGAGIVSLRNALAVVMGSNVGTTLGNWIVATLGFEFDIAAIAFAIVGVAAIVLISLPEGKKSYHFARFFLAFGFVFLGLDLIKDSIEVLLSDFDFSRYEHYNAIVFVLIGLIITALIQSSSATVAIVLSALNTGTIPFEMAAAVVIGTELGTSVKIIIGAIGSAPDKWRLAVANIFFNFAITILAFALLGPLVKFTALILPEDDVLFRLVLFQSTMNIAGVLLFAPFLTPISRFLEKRIHGKDRPSAFVVGKKILKMPAIANDAMEQDTELLIHRVLRLNLEAFATTKKVIHAPKSIDETLDERNRKLKTYEDRYEDVKKSEGEILVYALKLIEEYPENHKRIEELVLAIRHAMHSAKAMKDVRHNRIEFRESADEVKFHHYINFRKQLEALYEKIDREIQAHRHPGFEGMVDQALKDYHERRNNIYDAAMKEKLSPEDLSSLLNVNRELYTSCKTIVQALQLFHASKASNAIGGIP